MTRITNTGDQPVYVGRHEDDREGEKLEAGDSIVVPRVHFSPSPEWRDGRWYLDGRPLHAGDQIEMFFPDGGWQPVRVFAADDLRCGLRVCVNFHGLLFTRMVGDAKLRWPEA